jgi:hypothetical protein
VPEETLSSTHDARDAEDSRLLEAKDHKLLENYVYLVQEWVSLRVRNRAAADEVVQRVFLRLASELEPGKTYNVPYRVVVWNVVKWARTRPRSHCDSIQARSRPAGSSAEA